MAIDDGRHPDAEQLAEYADGVLGTGARTEVEAHVENCTDCRAVLVETLAFLAVEGAGSQTRGSGAGPRVLPFRSRRWVTVVAAGFAAAAALVLAARLARPDLLERAFGPRRDRPELQELYAALANEPTRPVEGRLSGGFKYAPPPSPTGGPGDRDLSLDVRIAAATIEKLANGRDTPEHEAALGVAHLVRGDVDKAIASLGMAASARPSVAAIQSDLAAALLARAARRRSHDDFEGARMAADQALATAPANAEAAFNRALALEGLGAYEAREAWMKARALQENADWRTEVDRHLAAGNRRDR